MKVVQINRYNYGSTGSIMLNIGAYIENHGHSSVYVYPYARMNNRKQVKNALTIGNRVERNIHAILNLFTGLNGCFSIVSTIRLISKLKKISPSVIQLHNLHNCYINLPLLFSFLARSNIPVVWTLHDCWAFTGQCPYFSFVDCSKWKSSCYDCPQYKHYPRSYVDQTKLMYTLKRKWFTKVEKLQLVTPSHWLAGCVQESFLKGYPVRVIQNGIDLSKFKPTKSNFRVKYDCEKSFIVLGVSLVWSNRKGLDIFIELCSLLPEDFKIVLVGIPREIQKDLPKRCIAFEATSNVEELVEIYSAADVFLNPSREETMGLVTAEALACGTPVIVSNCTAVPEIATSECGIVVEDYSAESFAKELLAKPRFSEEACINRAREFDSQLKYDEYLELYKDMVDLVSP